MTKEFIEKILKYSDDNCIPEKYAAEHFGISQNTFRHYKKKFGFKMCEIGKGKFTHRNQRVYSVNDDFFEVPNILNCYWAGFIAADGYVRKNELKIDLSLKDKTQLYRFKSDIGYQGIIHEYKVEKVYKNKKRIFEACYISITSEKIVNDLLKNFNITNKKSLILLPPNINDKNLIDAFICGYIDGDGSVCLYTNYARKVQKSLTISMLGTHEMMLWVQNRFYEMFGKKVGCIGVYNKNKDDEHKNTYKYTLGASKYVRTLFLHFYEMSIKKMERKWSDEIYEYCVNYKKQKPVCRRKGVNVFDINGNFIKHFDTLLGASEFTGVSVGRISSLCKINDSNHIAKGYMFSRGEHMKKYTPSYGTNTKVLNELGLW